MTHDVMSSDLTQMPGAPVGPPMIGALLRIPLDAVLARMLDGLHADGFGDLNAAHLPVLRWPGPDGRRPSDLAREARMSRQAINYLLGELERLGYVVRRDDPDDRRSKRVHLTERGRAVARSIRGTVRAIEREWEEELGAERLDALRELLRDLNGTRAVRALRGTPDGAAAS
jgi:DNA-binding MarR family transcriptional regulator